MTSAYKEQHSKCAYKFSYYKLGQMVLQIGAAFLLQIGANAYFKLGQLFYYKLGQGLLQIRAVITNWGKVYYKLGQSLLQIWAGITNWGKLLQIGAQHAHLTNDMKRFLIQAPDLVWNKPLKATIVEYYDEWIENGIHKYTATGNLKHVPR